MCTGGRGGDSYSGLRWSDDYRLTTLTAITKYHHPSTNNQPGRAAFDDWLLFLEFHGESRVIFIV